MPEGRFLVSRHDDRPGVFGNFGTILGQHDVHIASIAVVAMAPRGNAMMILAVDDPVSPEVLAPYATWRACADLRYVELGGASIS